jgi:predicted RNA-binding Zn-ribbon protein involved in translation (DUF1610 family)
MNTEFIKINKSEDHEPLQALNEQIVCEKCGFLSSLYSFSVDPVRDITRQAKVRIRIAYLCKNCGHYETFRVSSFIVRNGMTEPEK